MTGSKHRRRRLVMTIVLAALAGAAPAAAAELPLGEKGLPETRERTVLAPGATYTRIVRGTTGDEYFVIGLGFTLDRGEAEASAAKLRAEGYDARVLTVDLTAPDARLPGPVAHLVRLGRFATAAEAQATQTTLVAAGYQRVRVDYTGDDGTPTTGPWRIHVLEVDPRRFRGRLAPILATDFVPERETVSSIDARTGALAVINGGYFVIGAGDGTPGDLAGLSILRDRLVSEAVNGRTDLLLARPNGRGTRVAALSTRLTAVASDGARRTVDGRNRKPGLIRSCGGVGGDLPTELPRHDFTCTDAAELIQYTADFGAATDATAELEAVLDANGRVERCARPAARSPRTAQCSAAPAMARSGCAITDSQGTGCASASGLARACGAVTCRAVWASSTAARGCSRAANRPSAPPPRALSDQMILSSFTGSASAATRARWPA